MTVTVHVHANDATRFGQFGEHGTKQLRAKESTVQQEQRLTLAPDLEPIVHAVGGDIAAAIRLRDRLLCPAMRGGCKRHGCGGHNCDFAHSRLRLLCKRGTSPSTTASS